MPDHLYKSKYLIAILVTIILFFSACKKTEQVYVANVFEQYFEQNILNKNFIVNYAKDRGTDISSQFIGDTFMLFKNTYYDGPMTAIKNGITYTGTWSSNSDYGKLVINITQPTPPAEFNFINRDWRFTEKALPVMKLAPWGSTDSTALYMERLP
ncbi:MAG: hypothetical protein WCH52_07930 [Bacteroidota bacterium]